MLDYRAVWRWHFYAGLFCIPFIVALLLFGLFLPLFAVSLIVVLLVERFILRRVPGARNWLGLT